MLSEIEHKLDPDKTDQQLINNEYLAVRDQIKDLAKKEELEQIIQDLEEINKYA
jgi:hypothetical protein